MSVYFVDDGGTPTAPYDTWAKAAASIQALDTAVALASGDIVYIGADANCTDAGAALTIVGPTSGLPVTLISSTVGAGSDASYSVGTGDQILATGAASDITFDGAFVLIGILVRAGRHILISGDTDEPCAAKYSIFAVGNNANFQVSAATFNYRSIINCTVDLSADSGAASAAVVNAVSGGLVEIIGMQFLSPSNRTGTIFSTDRGRLVASGCDFSGFTNASIELISGTSSSQVYTNCKTHSTWLPWPTASGFNASGEALFSNVGPTDDPQSMQLGNIRGLLYSSSTVYRTGGAAVEAAATSWLVTTTAYCSEVTPFYTPWFYGTVNSTGAKTFDCYITNDTADFTDAQVWLEVEYLATADVGQWSLATDQRATITTTAAAQTTVQAAVYGSDLVSDGTFTTGVPWTAEAGWAIGSGLATGTGATGNLDESLTTTAGNYYEVTFTVSGYVSGDVRARFTGASNVSGTLRNANGTYTETLYASVTNSILRFIPATAFTGSIDNVIVKQISTPTGNEWNGTGPAFLYQQKLSVTAVIGETGQYRARVAVGVASIAGSRYFYVDPKITVS